MMTAILYYVSLILKNEIGVVIMIKIFVYVSLFFSHFFVYGVPFQGTKVLISGPSPYLPSIVRNIYNQGGNIIDIAVASALSLSVTHPYYVSLGCGGFALVKMNSSIKVLDFREMAPYEMKEDFYTKSKLSSQKGGSAVGVPGFLAGLEELHKKYGKLSWSRLVEPSIVLAQKGFFVSGDWADITHESKKAFNTSGKKIFFKNGKAYKPGDVFKQPKLVKALYLVKKNKSRDFYHGVLGRDVIAAVQNSKGVMSRKDLKKYKVRWLKPLSVRYRGYKVNSMPLPSSGGVILSRALKLIEKQKLYKKTLYSVEEFHLLGEIMARAFQPRFLMGDPDFISFKERDWLSKDKINNMNKTISSHKVKLLPKVKESGETTHISLIDRKGNAVAMTLTLNGYYGSGVVTKKYGIVLNNQMDDFTTLFNKSNLYGLVQGKNNKVEGGKRPLSSMTPVIVEKNGKTIMALGGAGGPKIITSVLQTLYRYLSHGLDIDQSIQSPRIHNQFLPRTLFIENKRMSPEVAFQLKQKGHKVEYRNYMGQVFGVALNRKGVLSAGHESRKEGASGGL